MCVSPIRIVSNNIAYRDGYDKATRLVPCGHCYECRAKRGNDWYVRAAVEWQHRKGSVFFLTNTYNEHSLKYFDTRDFEFAPKVYIPAINRLEIVAFVKQLRAYLSGDSSLPYDILLEKYGFRPFDGLKVLIIPEYGETTHRPHYHGLYFLPCKMDPLLFQRMAMLAWSDRKSMRDVSEQDKQYIQANKSLIDDEFKHDGMFHSGSWIYNAGDANRVDNADFVLLPPSGARKQYRYQSLKGFCDYAVDKSSGQLRPEVESVIGCKYLVKYFHKDDPTYSMPEYVEMRDWLRSVRQKCIALNKTPDCMISDADKKLLHEVKYVRQHMPFVVSSQKFGDNLFEEINNAPPVEKARLCLDKIHIPGDYRKDGKPNQYAVPQWIINRLLYWDDTVYNRQYDNYVKSQKVRMLTDLGIEVLKLRYDLYIRYYTDLVNLYTSLDNLCLTDIAQIDTEQRLCNPRTGELYTTWYDLARELQRQLRLVPAEKIAVYNLVYRDVKVPSWHLLSVDDACQVAPELWHLEIDGRNELRRDVDKYQKAQYIYSDVSSAQAYTYNRAQPWYNDSIVGAYDCEWICQTVEYLRQSISQFIHGISKQDMAKVKRYQDIINTFFYSSFNN